MKLNKLLDWYWFALLAVLLFVFVAGWKFGLLNGTRLWRTPRPHQKSAHFVPDLWTFCVEVTGFVDLCGGDGNAGKREEKRIAD